MERRVAVEPLDGGRNGVSRRKGPEVAPARGAFVSCPSCYEPMTLEHCSGVAIDVCKRCPAAWLDAGELEALQRSHERVAVWELPTSTSFSSTDVSSLVRCQSCRTGHLVPGRIGERQVLRCERCGGIFLYLPESQFAQARARQANRTRANPLAPASFAEEVLWIIVQALSLAL